MFLTRMLIQKNNLQLEVKDKNETYELTFILQKILNTAKDIIPPKL